MEYLKDLNQLLSELSSFNSVEEMGAHLCKKSRKLTGADGVAVIVFGATEYEPIATEASRDAKIFPKGKKAPLKDSIFDWCVKRDCPAYLEELQSDERAPSDLGEGNRVQCLAVIPMRNPSPIGAITFAFREKRQWTDTDRALMECLASSAELALRNMMFLGRIDQIVSERTSALERVNDELETFAYTVSHDLKNPLSVVKTNCWTILELMAEETPDTVLQCVRRIDTASERMKRQIDGMLSMYRLTNEEFNFTDVNLSAIAGELADQHRCEQPGRKVEFTIESDLHAYGDERTLRVVIQNLFSNAWKYSANDSLTKIEFFSLNTEEDGLVFCVRDNGIGFNEEEARKLFRVFQRLPGAEEIDGHGIGLTSVRRIINKHGGRVWAEGEKGRGASFFFTLPLLPIDSELEGFMEKQIEAAEVIVGAKA